MHFVTLTCLLTSTNVYLINVPKMCRLFLTRRILSFFPLIEAVSINTCFHNWKHWFFFNPAGSFSPLLVLSPTGYVRGFFSYWIYPQCSHYDCKFQTSFPAHCLLNFSNFSNVMLSMVMSTFLWLNYAFPYLWFYSHICQFRHFSCRMWCFLSNVQLQEAFWRRGEMFWT